MSAFDTYYADPTPINALKLAISDLRAQRSPEWDYIQNLDTALTILEANHVRLHNHADLLISLETLHPRDGVWRTPDSFEESKILRAMEKANSVLQS